MASKTSSRNRYFDMAENNTFQTVVFCVILCVFIVAIFHAFLPLITYIVKYSLNGRVYNNGVVIPVQRDMPEPINSTSYYFRWAIDIYLKTPQEGRYWFNPMMSLVMPCGLISLGLSVCVSSILAPGIGYIRRKIEREIANQVDKISYKSHGFYSDSEQRELERRISMADLRDLHELADELDVSLEDLKVIHKAILWKDKSFLYRIGHVNDGLAIYMRFHFTQKYSNTMLGLVYIGASILILIIGLRGLKFIPPTEPSMVFFSLGLEFSMLITYAITLMYSKEEEVAEKPAEKPSAAISSAELGSAREVEKLLKVFIKSQKSDDKNK